MNLTGQFVQSEVAALIAEFGSTLTRRDGSTIKALLDTRPEIVQKMETTDLLDPMETARAVVLYLPGDAPDKPGDTVTISGRAYRLRQVRETGFQDVVGMQTFLGTPYDTEG